MPNKPNNFQRKKKSNASNQNRSSQTKKKARMPELKGFYFDYEKNRYFPLVPLSKLPASSNALQEISYSSQNDHSGNSRSDLNLPVSRLKYLKNKTIDKKDQKMNRSRKINQKATLNIPGMIFSSRISLKFSFNPSLKNRELLSSTLLKNKTNVYPCPIVSQSIFPGEGTICKIKTLESNSSLLCGTSKGSICNLKFKTDSKNSYSEISNYHCFANESAGKVTNIAHLDSERFIFSTLGGENVSGSVNVFNMHNAVLNRISNMNKSIFSVSTQTKDSYSAYSNFIAVGGEHCLSVYDSQTFSNLFNRRTRSDILSTIFFDGNQNCVLSGKRNGSICLYDVRNKDKPSVYFLHNSGIYLSDIRFISETHNNNINKNVVHSYEFGNNRFNMNTSISVSPDKSVLAVGIDQKIKLWDIFSFKLLNELSTPQDITCISLNPNSIYRRTSICAPINLLVSSNKNIYKFEM
ncbi:hypothetical protein BB560_007208 [Smittium megazygosporum]|uniref:Uncharacterized protein n=1 Tax=Smittium megazygosporum TaxID=133381 RepID=A0A2T9XXW2_9FUNG|nr:hypothetical protein BB560_007208 [Smittium megazygosporum]